jgi:four helix bundle protein
MKSDNVVQQKSLAFAIKIVNAYKILKNDKEFTVSKQLLRSGTSIGANVEEVIGAQSKADFISKLSIAYKEARETLYWVKLLMATDLLSKQTGDSLIADAEELCRIIGAIQITSKQNRNS